MRANVVRVKLSQNIRQAQPGQRVVVADRRAIEAATAAAQSNPENFRVRASSPAEHAAAGAVLASPVGSPIFSLTSTVSSTLVALP